MTFNAPFTLNRDVGELPAGSYAVETDEEEILVSDRTAYRRTAIHLYVATPTSTRTIVVEPADLDSALKRDGEKASASPGSESSGTPAADGRE